MHTTNSLLDACKKHFNLPSDYALAAKLGLTRQRISAWRCGESGFSDDNAIVIADLLGYDRACVLLSIQAERAQKGHHPALFSTLESAFKRLGGAAAAICFLGIFTPTPEAQAAPVLSSSGPTNVYYVKSHLSLRRRIRALFLLFSYARFRHIPTTL